MAQRISATTASRAKGDENVIPVDQSFIDDVAGDCLRACVASVCNLAITEVPKFSESGFLPAVVKWARESGKTAIWMDIPDFTSLDKIWFGNVPEYFIAWGKSPRPKVDGGAKQHCVVVSRKGYGVKVVHDPHPDRTGLKTMCGFCFIVDAERVPKETK